MVTHPFASFSRGVDPLLVERMGRQRYPQARELTITADCGGSNGARVRLWKLDRFAARRATMPVPKRCPEPPLAREVARGRLQKKMV